MDVTRRDFMQLAGMLSAGTIMSGCASGNSANPKKIISTRPNDITGESLMDFESVGNCSILHICDLHAHLKPLYWREPSTLISAPNLVGNPGFICGDQFRNYYNEKPGSIESYFDTYLNFDELSKKFGKMGGVAHIKTIADRVRSEKGEENVLFLDSGDTWQGTAVALETGGEAIVEAQNDLGIDVMVGHWEFTYGKERVMELVDKLHADFIAQNVIDNDPFSDNFEESVFKPYTTKVIGGNKIGIIGQAFPFTSTANPKHLTEGWSFGIRTESLQSWVDMLREEEKCDAIVVLSHDGFSVDQEVAKKVNGIDFILSGHTHDPAPRPIVVNNTVIIISGSHGKYVSRLDLDIKNHKIVDWSYKLIPVASDLIPANPTTQALVEKLYAPYEKDLSTVIGKTKNTLYKRDTFYSTFDALIGNSIKDVMDSEISFTPGYRWGTTVVAGDSITKDHVYDMTAITYPEVYTFDLKGSQLKNLLEDIADNVFNANPLYQQGGDMSRLGGITYDIKVGGKAGQRIGNVKINGKSLDLGRNYKVSAWGGNLQNAGENLRESMIKPVYDVAIDYISRQGEIDIKTSDTNVNVVDFQNGCPKPQIQL
ncbi:MAG: thiosulfohydrolase SoxB [Campylobacterota bacterium]|nr:thiosulfohydrolase SoxB [Campylobacterota bacterium]